MHHNGPKRHTPKTVIRNGNIIQVGHSAGDDHANVYHVGDIHVSGPLPRGSYHVGIASKGNVHHVGGINAVFTANDDYAQPAQAHHAQLHSDHQVRREQAQARQAQLRAEAEARREQDQARQAQLRAEAEARRAQDQVRQTQLRAEAQARREQAQAFQVQLRAEAQARTQAFQAQLGAEAQARREQAQALQAQLRAEAESAEHHAYMQMHDITVPNGSNIHIGNSAMGENASIHHVGNIQVNTKLPKGSVHIGLSSKGNVTHIGGISAVFTADDSRSKVQADQSKALADAQARLKAQADEIARLRAQAAAPVAPAPVITSSQVGAAAAAVMAAQAQLAEDDFKLDELGRPIIM